MKFFPSSEYADAGVYAGEYFSRLAAAAATVDQKAVADAGRLLAERSGQGRMLFSCGNGGSAAISNHLVCDCMKGVRTGGLLKPRVNSLSSTVELITAIANDIGVEDVFSFQLSSLAKEDDVLIAISSSGSSPNIIKAIHQAKELKMKTIAMSGFDGGEAARLADISLHVRADNYGLVEDVHQSLMHILAQYLRHAHMQDVSQLGKVKF